MSASCSSRPNAGFDGAVLARTCSGSRSQTSRQNEAAGRPTRCSSTAAPASAVCSRGGSNIARGTVAVWTENGVVIARTHRAARGAAAPHSTQGGSFAKRLHTRFGGAPQEVSRGTLKAQGGPAKPAAGVRGGETFVDKIDANEHDWILSVRVTGIARSGAREKAIEALAEHFRMYVREELATVGTDNFDSVFKPENQPKMLIDKASEARPHDGAAIYSLVTSDDEGAAHVQEMLAPTQPMDEQQELSLIHI